MSSTLIVYGTIIVQIGFGGELLNPFRAIDPDLAIPLGIVLISVFPGLWFLHTFRILDSELGGEGSTLMSSKLEVLFVIAVTGITFGGFSQVPIIRYLLTLLAITLTIASPILIGVLIIRQLMMGSL